jgi:mRNA interferase MazF
MTFSSTIEAGVALLTAAVVTVSDSCSRGERADISGPAVAEVLGRSGFRVVCFEMSSMWSILWNRFHICKSFKSCWIKSCYTPPTKPRSALGETGPLWCATPCGNISVGWNCEPVKSATARATHDSRKPTRKRGVGNRRPRGRKSSPRRGSALPVCAPDKKRPALVLTRNSAIAYLSTVTVAPVTSTIRGVPSEVVLNEEDGMKSPCAVNLHNAVTVSQQRLGKRVAQLSSARMNEVCAALRFSLGCDSN